MQELLETHDFLDKVASRQEAAPFVADAPRPFSDAELGKVAGAVGVSATGPQVISVLVTAKEPGAATGLAGSVIAEFMSEVSATLHTRGQALVDYQKQSLDTATASLGTAQKQLDDYTKAHPGATSQEATVGQLESAVVGAQEQVAKAQDAYTQAKLTLATASDASAFRTVDKPSAPTAPQSRRSKMLFTAVGAVLAGIVVSLGLLTLFVATDSSAREAADVEDNLGLELVGTVGRVSDRRRQQRRAS
jgi:capsular polysaccharide biosynthesis protein